MATLLSSTPASTGRTLSRSSALSSPVSPTRLSRQQEKEDLRQLNDRLAAYIDRVRALEADKSLLQRRVEEQEESSSRELGNLRLRYETELADARRTLDGIAMERATLQVELGKLGEEHRQLYARNSKKEADLNVSLARVRDLDAQLNSKEAELATALSGKRNLENELQELKDQILSLKVTLEDTTKHLHSEMLQRVDLENQMRSLQEQMAFQKNLHEDELKETKRFHESRITEIETGRQREFESKLSNALQGLRKEHEEQIKGYKEELERTFSAKVSLYTSLGQANELVMLLPCEQVDMENAQLSAAKNSDFANAAREELLETKLRVDTLMSQVNQYQNQIAALEARSRELQETLDHDREMHRKCMAEKEREMALTRHQMQAQLEEYEHLLDVKLALDLEINAYRKMLEGEEQRLKLSSSPSSQSVGTQAATSQSRRFLQGKKRKLKEAKKGEHSVSFKIVQHASSSGNVSIEEIDTEGKFVKLKNNSDEDQSLNGWVLRCQLGNSSDIIYRFPARFVLQAGQVVSVWGTGAGVSPSSSDLVWKSQKSWGTGENIGITLVNADGEVSEIMTEVDFEDPSCSIM
uniref:Lamin-L(III) n=1 Tax=Sphenodon punctatus TaxID=8508 RepID=A0A8D0G698_SPHPU